MKPTATELVNRLLQEQQAQLSWAKKHFHLMEDGHYFAIAINNEECALAPFPEFSAMLYRGQTQYWEQASPSLYRNNMSYDEELLERIRVAEFELLLQKHPAILDFKNERVMGLRVRIDFEGLAQHYGLKTELFDFTSNLFVAAFFACCETDGDSENGYRPITKPGEGVIYALNSALDIAVEQTPYSSVVGLQPLSRPGDQYAWAYRLTKGSSLNSRRFISAYHFRHNKQTSQKIYDYFEGGRKLFPLDPVTIKADAIAQSTMLSNKAVDLALSRCSNNKDNGATLKALIAKGLEITDQQHFSFSSIEIEQAQSCWADLKQDLLSRIHFRRAIYPS